MKERMNKLMGGWEDVWMDEWEDVWMDEWMD